jgi:hypothetical protein
MTADMKSPATNPKAAPRIVLALALAAMGFAAANTGDAPGAAVIGTLLMTAAVVLGVRTARHRLPAWAARSAMAAGALIAALVAFVTYTAAVTEPLFAQPQDIPSVVGAAPPPQYAASVEAARELVRAAVREQNLPGVSVAVGADAAIVWSEGFGWRDADTRTPVTPDTRFNIGTAASAVPADVVATLGLTSTGADAAGDWNPGHTGEPEEDFPPFTHIRRNILQPLGLVPFEYPLPSDRATFYVPRADANPLRGRQLMYMRDLACCAGTMASYTTAADLVRVGLANGGSINGELAGGMVASLLTLRDRGIVIAVLSNMAHANTSGLAAKIGEAFATQTP